MRDQYGRILVYRWSAVQAVAVALAVGIAIGACEERWAASCFPGLSVSGWIGESIDERCAPAIEFSSSGCSIDAGGSLVCAADR